MSVFSERLSDARKEKNIPQKAAAADLGVSQALLSHYEKGIRECSPGFIARAAAYYDVSADYLLGLSDKPHNMNTVFAEEEQPLDGEDVSQTVFRALVWLSKEAGKLSPECVSRIMDAYAFALYQSARILMSEGKMTEQFVKLSPEAEWLTAVAELSELRALEKAVGKTTGRIETCPLCVQTVLRKCEDAIRRNINQLHVE